ncbi:zinc finger protein Gfi-1b-like isoform X2 [Paramacrobiotus metropolitanus]|nr:zinc finger protein Gfi-1b-like isoform X2 [Paramacrobiotus metropolitanus]
MEHRSRNKYCDICGQAFTLASSLSRHKDVHSSLRRFICGMCGRSYKHYASMRKHQNVHAGEIFNCEICGKEFNQALHLKAHAEAHHMARRHICQFCGKTYTQASNLKSHERNVHQFPQYSCPVCRKPFETMIDLREHFDLTVPCQTSTKMAEGDVQTQMILKTPKLSRTVNYNDGRKAVQLIDHGGVEIVQIREFPAEPRKIRMY